MALRPSTFAILLHFICGFVIISSQKDVEYDPTVKTMEEFSGYQIHEPNFQDSLSTLSVDTESLQKQVDELSSFSDAPAPAVTRVLYSDKDVLARRYIKNLMGLSGLSVREDAVGNIFGRWDGYEPELAPVSTGSHVDAIPFSGKYDGVVGVLGAIEAINVLKRSGFKPKRSLEVIMFTSEEPTRFGISCLGSRLLAGSQELAELLKTTVDGQNISFSDAARLAGYNNADLSSVFLNKGSYSAFIELHIEQGPILEEEGTSIGVVTAIAAPASIKVDFEGNGGHAGAVLMPTRNDAGLAAAELALAVENHVLESGSIDTVGTVGILDLHPGAINSIPSKSHLEIVKYGKRHRLKNIYALKRGMRIIMEELNTIVHVPYTIDQLEMKIRELRLKFALFKNFCDLPGVHLYGDDLNVGIGAAYNWIIPVETKWEMHFRLYGLTNARNICILFEEMRCAIFPGEAPIRHDEHFTEDEGVGVAVDEIEADGEGPPPYSDEDDKME